MEKEKAPTLPDGKVYVFTATYYLVDGSEVKDTIKARDLLRAQHDLYNRMSLGGSTTPARQSVMVNQNNHKVSIIPIPQIVYATVEHDYENGQGKTGEPIQKGYKIVDAK